MIRPTERFTTRAGDYARHRPGYPAGALDLLAGRCGLAAGACVADLGSGTGILTGLLLERGAEVFAVEPNDAMRAAAEAQLGGRAGFHSMAGSAEATGLPGASIDLAVAGQAFHWFEVAPARAELLRILRRGSWAALLWNERPPRLTPFLAEYDALLTEHAPDYTRIVASRADPRTMGEYLGAAMEVATFPNQQVLDFAGLEGRLMSSSYAPQKGAPEYRPLMARLRELFDRHAVEGRVVMPYETLVYFGRPAPR
ncbi:MAG TPA: class I SAM-dependent methyltransferase [Steroidobacteraceae bacterium]|nr:class I SAM-dependent methyltransferase [Gammaproteobacteria bacterium]HEV2285596.1 class I SAM-dependent methyltransferase [Steroidobacteraceae bacterium]